MDRRHFLRGVADGAIGGGAGLAALLLGGCGPAREAFAQERGGSDREGADAVGTARGESGLRITRVRPILTAPEGIRLVLVKVETSDPGLWGVGCATFTQRARTVETAVEKYLDPFLRGKNPDNIEDIWQASFQSSYWRNGPVLMNALSGVDMALWDIKGKRAGMPVYQLLGGKCRVAAPVYRHAGGSTGEEAVERVRRFMEQGFRHVRVQVGVRGQTTYGQRSSDRRSSAGDFGGNLFEPTAYQLAVPKVFEHVRKEIGDELELLHDVHERLHPIQAIKLCKDLEKFRLFFLEDPFAPEDVGYFKHLRQQCATPIAMGELFNNPNEWLDLISGRLIDFIRCHLSQIGGITMARKLAALCDFYRVRTAWHGPGDTSPVGHAANLHVDLSTWNFGIQEAYEFRDSAREVFPGAPTLRDGMMWANDEPGLGVDIDELAAAKYPIQDDPPFDLKWGQLRDRDGTIRRP